MVVGIAAVFVFPVSRSLVRRPSLHIIIIIVIIVALYIMLGTSNVRHRSIQLQHTAQSRSTCCQCLTTTVLPTLACRLASHLLSFYDAPGQQGGPTLSTRTVLLSCNTIPDVYWYDSTAAVACYLEAYLTPQLFDISAPRTPAHFIYLFDCLFVCSVRLFWTDTDRVETASVQRAQRPTAPTTCTSSGSPNKSIKPTQHASTLPATVDVVCPHRFQAETWNRLYCVKC